MGGKNIDHILRCRAARIDRATQFAVRQQNLRGKRIAGLFFELIGIAVSEDSVAQIDVRLLQVVSKFVQHGEVAAAG